MKYKGYIGKVLYDEHEKMLHGSVVNTRDVITFMGSTAAETEQALRDSVEDYLAWCAELGVEPNKPYSGQFMVRLDPRVHAALVAAAANEDISLNDFVRARLEAAVAVAPTAPARTPKGRRPRATAAARSPTHGRRNSTAET